MTARSRLTLRTTDAGFSIVELFVILVVVSAITGAGVYVWNTRSKKDSAVASTSADVSSKIGDRYAPPADYLSFKDTTLGFSLAYPAVFGALGDAQTHSKSTYRQTATTAGYGGGVEGNFTLFIYDSAHATIGSRKYGPGIQLQNGKWIVTQANEADVKSNKVGAEYKDLNNKALAPQSNNGLEVYTLVSKDENAETDALVFIVGDKTYALLLPTFNSATSSSDEAAFSKMLVNVRASIRVTQ